MQETLTPNTARPAGSPSRAHVWPRDAAPSGPSSKVAFPCVCLCEEKLYKGEAGRLVSRSEKRVHGRCACGGNSVWGGGVLVRSRSSNDADVTHPIYPYQNRACQRRPCAIALLAWRTGSGGDEPGQDRQQPTRTSFAAIWWWCGVTLASVHARKQASAARPSERSACAPRTSCMVRTARSPSGRRALPSRAPALNCTRGLGHGPMSFRED